MASSPNNLWKTDWEKMETTTDFIFLGSKITADGDSTMKLKTLVPWKKNYDKFSVSKNRGICFPDKDPYNQNYVLFFFPVFMYKCESWTIKKAEHQRIDAFELWCWRRLLRLPWTTSRPN